MDQVKVQGGWGRFVVCTLLLSATLGSSALHAQSSGLPDLAQVSRAGLELMPAVPGVAGEPGPRVFPFEPLERDPTDGLRHGWVTTTTGRFGFTITELTLPARVPFAVGRLWDGGMGALLPGVPTQEPRPANDFGPNWMFWPTSALIPTSSTTMLLWTDQGHVVTYVKQTGGTTYYPNPDRPFPYGPATPTGDGGYHVQQSNGLRSTYRTVPGEGNYWLVKREDPSGNALNLTYRDGLLERIDATDGSWVQLYRPQWGEPAPAGTKPKRIVRIADSAGRQTNYSYNSVGQLIAATDTAGNTWEYVYDGADHIAQVIDPLDRAVFQVTTLSNHKATMVKLQDAVTNYTYATSQTTVADAYGGSFTYAFDYRGNTTQVTDAGGGVTTLARHATTNDLISVTDPEGGLHQFLHDSGHRITRYTAPVVNGSSAIWDFTYDASGRLTKVKAPNNAVTQLTYNTAGWLIKEATDPNADGTAEAETVYVRHATNGDILTVTDPSGRVMNYEYHAKGMISKVKPPCLPLSGGGQACPEVIYEFDAAGRMIKARWPVAANTWNDWIYTWNAQGAMTAVKDPLNNTWQTSYNHLGAPTQITAPSGTIKKYFWRIDGQLYRVEDENGFASWWDYTPSGRPDRFNDAEGHVWTMAYDVMGRQTELKDPENRVWKKRYDLAGRLEETETPGGRVIQIVRDAMGRMTQRQLPGGAIESFTWDGASNLTFMEQQYYEGSTLIRDRWTWTYDGRGLPLTLVQELVDGSGTFSKNSSWSWDLSGKLSSFNPPGGGYYGITRDSWGRTTAISGSSSTALAEWDPWSGFVLRRYHGDKQLDEYYSWDAAGRIASFREANTAGNIRHLQFARDAQGRVLTSTNLLTTPNEVETLTYL
jgi:YD repeat-containing protein